MKYVFLEKNIAEENKRNNNVSIKHFYNYFYYITEDPHYTYNEHTSKKEIHFDIGQTIEDNFTKITDITQADSNGDQNILGDVLGYILYKELFDKNFIKFTVNDDDKNNIKIENVEF